MVNVRTRVLLVQELVLYLVSGSIVPLSNSGVQFQSVQSCSFRVVDKHPVCVAEVFDGAGRDYVGYEAYLIVE